MEPDRASKLGFIGTGTITSAIVEGLCAGAAITEPIRVSPRNEKVAAALAARFPNVIVGASNQDVVDASDVVFLAVRPQVALAVLEALRFRPEQRIVSLIATFPRARVAALVSPAQAVTCAVPQPTVSARLSPTAIFPPDRFVAAIFDELGAAFEASSEREFQALFATTAAMATFFTLLDTLARWLVKQEVSPETARNYVTKMFQGLANVPGQSKSSFTELAAEFKTKGGLNEQFANVLAERGAFIAFSSALDLIFDRIIRSENR
jgi:pyrroline-5-carboxylate reductase